MMEMNLFYPFYACFCFIAKHLLNKKNCNFLIFVINFLRSRLLTYFFLCFCWFYSLALDSEWKIFETHQRELMFSTYFCIIKGSVKRRMKKHQQASFNLFSFAYRRWTVRCDFFLQLFGNAKEFNVTARKRKLKMKT